MKNPTSSYLSDFSQAKIALSLYFFVCFLLNGIISVMLGIFYYQVIDSTIEFSSLGTSFPLEVVAFSQSYGLLVIGVAAGIIYTLFNYKKVGEDFKQAKINIQKNPMMLINSALIFGIMAVMLLILSKMVGMSFLIPKGFADFINHDLVNKFHIGVILMLFSYIEELVFRKVVIDALDERFLLGDFAQFVIMAIIYAFFNFLVFLDYTLILPSLIFGIGMGYLYRYTKDNFAFGFVFRAIFIIIFLVITF